LAGVATAATAEAAATSEAAATGTEEVLRRGKKRRGSRGVSRQRKKNARWKERERARAFGA